MTKFKKGQIIVATSTKKRSCGMIECHEGEINKVVDPEPDWHNDIKVYRGLENERKNKRWKVPVKAYRPATPEEEQAYAEGKRNKSEICQSV